MRVVFNLTGPACRYLGSLEQDTADQVAQLGLPAQIPVARYLVLCTQPANQVYFRKAAK